MAKANWYVLQVSTGQEDTACQAVLRACEDLCDLSGEPLVRECFVPRYRTQYKLHGSWHDEDRVLLPGYAMVVTAEPWALVRKLREVPRLTRLLKVGETFAPLSDDDRDWIEQWKYEGDRTLPMSIAYKEGDRVVVTSGPLKGREASITRIRRRQSLAELEIHAGQICVHATVGLAILPKPQAAPAG